MTSGLLGFTFFLNCIYLCTDSISFLLQMPNALQNYLKFLLECTCYSKTLHWQQVMVNALCDWQHYFSIFSARAQSIRLQVAYIFVTPGLYLSGIRTFRHNSIANFCTLTWTTFDTRNGMSASIGTTHGEIVVPKFLARNGPSGTYSHFCMSRARRKAFELVFCELHNYSLYQVRLIWLYFL